MERPEPYPEPQFERKVNGRIILGTLISLIVILLIVIARHEGGRKPPVEERDLGGADQKEAIARERRQLLLEADTTVLDTMILVP